MKEETEPLKASDDTLSIDFQESSSAIKPEKEPFLIFDVNSKLSFEDKSAIYNSLVALVKAGYPFPDNLQDRAAQFLRSLEPLWGDHDYADKRVTELVPSSATSPSGFIGSIVILLSSPHSTAVGATMLFVFKTTVISSRSYRCRLVESDLVPNVLETVQPHTLPISGNEEIISNLITIIEHFVNFASPSCLRNFGLITPAENSNHREMIFQKVVIPSSQFVTFLISTRSFLNEDLFRSFMQLLVKLLRIGPYHRPTLEFVLASPITMAFSSCLSFVEYGSFLYVTLNYINDSLGFWKAGGQEVVQSGKRMMQALFSEGFEDIVEQKMIQEKSRYYGIRFVANCHTISQKLGSNAKRQ